MKAKSAKTLCKKEEPGREQMKKPLRHRIGTVFFTINLTFRITYEKPLSVVSTECLHNFFFTQAKIKAIVSCRTGNQQITRCFFLQTIEKDA